MANNLTEFDESCKEETFNPPLRIRNILIKDTQELNSLIQLGPGIPSKYASPPWRLTLTDDFGIKQPSTVKKLNELLHHSMKVQGATVAATGGGTRQNLMRVDTMAVFGLVRSFIKTLLGPEDKIPDLIQGARSQDQSFQQGRRETSSHGQGTGRDL